MDINQIFGLEQRIGTLRPDFRAHFTALYDQVIQWSLLQLAKPPNDLTINFKFQSFRPISNLQCIQMNLNKLSPQFDFILVEAKLVRWDKPHNFTQLITISLSIGQRLTKAQVNDFAQVYINLVPT